MYLYFFFIKLYVHFYYKNCIEIEDLICNKNLYELYDYTFKDFQHYKRNNNILKKRRLNLFTIVDTYYIYKKILCKKFVSGM